MKMWLSSVFTVESFPNWNCPFCQKGLLQLTPGKFTSTLLATGSYSFNGALCCNVCYQQVDFKGEGEMQQIGYYPSLSDYFHEEERVVYTPRQFYPSIPIFKWPAKCPQKIKTELHHCLDLYWVDVVLCKNKIQTVLELLLSFQRQRTNNSKKNRKTPVQLSTTIKNLIQLYPDSANDFSGLKWMCKSKSDISKYKILDAFQSLELILCKLYPDE